MNKRLVQNIISPTILLNYNCLNCQKHVTLPPLSQILLRCFAARARPVLLVGGLFTKTNTLWLDIVSAYATITEDPVRSATRLVDPPTHTRFYSGFIGFLSNLVLSLA